MRYVVGVWTDRLGNVKSHVMVTDEYDEYHYDLEQKQADMREWLLDNLTAREHVSSTVFTS